MLQKKVSVAPMINYSDKYAREFWRLLSPNTMLYTEMLVARALLEGSDTKAHFSPRQHPIALQIATCDPQQAQAATQIAVERGFDEINLNCGCPSNRVSSGGFGAVLMKNPALTSHLIKTMQHPDIICSVKCRIGIDDDTQEHLHRFIETLQESGVDKVIIHARFAWLDGINPKQNRHLPPLDYQAVYTIKKLFPKIEIHINGGITTLSHITQHLQHTDGVMLGREIINNPLLLQQIEQHLWKQDPIHIQEILENYMNQMEHDKQLHLATKPLLGLLHNMTGAKRMRAALCRKDITYDQIYKILIQSNLL